MDLYKDTVTLVHDLELYYQQTCLRNALTVRAKDVLAKLCAEHGYDKTVDMMRKTLRNHIQWQPNGAPVFESVEHAILQLPQSGI